MVTFYSNAKLCTDYATYTVHSWQPAVALECLRKCSLKLILSYQKPMQVLACEACCKLYMSVCVNTPEVLQCITSYCIAISCMIQTLDLFF